MTTVTVAERESALSQVAAMDTIGMNKGGTARQYVPIISWNKKETWVAVNTITNTVSANVPQPDPGRQVLCSCEGDCGSICYCYADQLPVSIICTLIFTVISALVLTPLSLLCCIPMLQHLHKAHHYAERNDMERARNHCNKYFCPCLGASVWIAVAVVFYVILAIGIVLGIIVHA